MGRYNILLENPKKSPGTHPPAQPAKREKEEIHYPETPKQSPPKHVKSQTNQDTSLHASNEASNHANMSLSPTTFLEDIRKAVKRVGKEVTFVRLTPEEKNQLGDIAYTYKRQGIKTSENEISRIGINYLLADYKAHGKDSNLAKVIDALNA